MTFAALACFGTATALAGSINLSEVTANTTVADGTTLTGTLGTNVKITIADGATVTLDGVAINGVNDEDNCSWAGITCEGGATIILKGANTVKGFYEDYPGIHVPEGKTLTIKGDGSLDASSNGYGAGIGGGGDYSQTGNFAYRFDRIVWGAILPAGQCAIRPEVLWCYLLPQLGCIAITMCGYECALILRGGKKEWAKAGLLFGISFVLFAAAAIVEIKVPVIKHIYSISFSLYATAWSVLALAVLYVVTDIWKFRRGMGIVLLFGQNALAAYMLRQMFSPAFATGAKFFTVGVPRLFGEQARHFADGTVAAVLLTLALFGWAVYKDWRLLRPQRVDVVASK